MNDEKPDLAYIQTLDRLAKAELRTSRCTDEQQIGLTERQPDGSWRIVKITTSQAEADKWLYGDKDRVGTLNEDE